MSIWSEMRRDPLAGTGNAYLDTEKAQPEQLSYSCGAGGAVIKLLPGVGAVIKKTPDPHDLIKDLKEF